MSQEIFNQATSKMQKAVEAFQHELSKMRTGRANMGLLDDVKVDYYGDKVPLNQVATLGVPEPRLITVQPWEAKIIPDIEKAIEKANLGLNPINDGKLIRLPIPALTEERRKELVKVMKSHGEEARVAVRHGRRDAMDVIKAQEKKKEISEDDAKKAGDKVQKITDDFIGQVDTIVHKKEAEIMQV